MIHMPHYHYVFYNLWGAQNSQTENLWWHWEGIIWMLHVHCLTVQTSFKLCLPSVTTNFLFENFEHPTNYKKHSDNGAYESWVMHVFGNFLLAAMFNKCNIMMFLVWAHLMPLDAGNCQWAHTEALEGFVKQILGPSEIIESTFQLIDGPTQRLQKVPSNKYWAHSKLLATSIKI